MKKLYAYILSIIMISVLFSSWYFFIRPSKKASGFILSFIESFDEENDSNPESFLSETVDDLSFISYYRERPETDLRILKTARKSFNTFITEVCLTSGEGCLQGFFHTVKTCEGFSVSRMPRVLSFKCCMPLSSEKKGENVLHTIDIAGKKYSVESSSGLSLETHKPVSIILFENMIAEANSLTPLDIDKVMSVTAAYIEGHSSGRISVDRSFRVYCFINGEPVYSSGRNIPAGTKNVTLYLLPGNNAVSAVYIRSNIPIDTIRTAIGKTGFSGLIHDSLTVGSDDGFSVFTKLPTTSIHNFSPSQKVVFKRYGDEIMVTSNGNEVFHSSERIYVQPIGEGTLLLYGIERAQSSGTGHTGYKGVIEVSPVMNGLSVVNELDLEKYLYSVVSSEMPAVFGLEPLKAQAVAARTYAVKSIMRTGFANYGANVDDSTSSQVYNNVAIKDEVRQAVDATRGLVLFFNGDLADTRYYSTSCGFSASSHEVWEDSEGNFPGKPVEYLSSLPQYPGSPARLDSDKHMKDFIAWMNPDFYDFHSPYFRWEVSFTGAQAEAIIRSNLERISGNELPPDLGRLAGIETVERGAGGNITHLVIKMASGEYDVFKELNIRRALQPVNLIKGEAPVVLHLKDGSTRENFSLLPSAFAVIETEKGDDGYVENVRITGGGFGHGVGMSQYGAYGLSLAGYSFDRILNHYYPGTELKYP